MQNKPGILFSHMICATLVSCALCGYSSDSMAWSPDGHSTIGILAMRQLEPDVRSELESIIGSLDEQAMIKACNWPDDVRESKEWEWSAPQHYINIPRGDYLYLKSRDCPDGKCVTEAIKGYAAELANQATVKEQRWQAFAWLCHLTADLHQPLHAGFADDRGGNNFDIIFKGDEMNLHGFWDFELINQHSGSWQNLVSLLSLTPVAPLDSDWSVDMVNEWTNDSHTLAKKTVYPATKNIDENYVQNSWVLVQQQISLAASRLALIINTTLKTRN